VPAVPLRRTQAERTATTRAALLAATVEAVVERGYAGASTTEICRRAGVSQGALFRHFPTKGAVLAAAVADLFPRIPDGFRAAAAGVPDGPDRVGAIVDLLFAAYRTPELEAAVELYVAARTDADLAAALAEVEPPHRARLHALAAELLPDAAGHPAFAAAVDVLVDAVQGASSGRLLVLGDGAPAARAALRDTLVGLVEAILPAPAAVDATVAR
jgi:AcrR family transcriptional regulator